MISKRIQGIFSAPYEKYFENGHPNPQGDLFGAGIGLPVRRNDWWDVREVWSYPYYTLNIMLGNGVGSYRNETGFQCSLTSGNFFFTFPQFKQQYGPAKGESWGELYVSFGGVLFEWAMEQRILSPEYPVWEMKRPERWVRRLQKLLQSPAPLTKQQSLHRSVRFLDDLMEMLHQAEPVQASKPEGDWFITACNLITSDLHHKVNWQIVASELGMSYHTFRLYFTRRAGMPPMRYREKVRIERACDELTRNTHKSCKEIAFNLGYSDAHHFSIQFRKLMNMSPSQYRRQSVGEKILL